MDRLRLGEQVVEGALDQFDDLAGGPVVAGIGGCAHPVMLPGGGPNEYIGGVERDVMVERPARLVGVLGTATEVGKTWTTAAIVRRLVADGHHPAVRKPVQSFDPADDHPSDAEVLAVAAGCPVGDVCPAARSLPVALAPPMACARLGLEPPSVADLLTETTWPTGCATGFVETVGGVLSPMAADGSSLDLVTALEPDLVLLIADARLGAINATRLSHLAIRAAVACPVRVILNRFDPADRLHRDNAAWLRVRDGLDVVTTADDEWERLVLR